MQQPDNLDHLLDTTPFGRVTIDIHRAYGQTQMIKARARSQTKTQTVEDVGAVVGDSLGELLQQNQTGRLEVTIKFKNGRLEYTVIESFVD